MFFYCEKLYSNLLSCNIKIGGKSEIFTPELNYFYLYKLIVIQITLYYIYYLHQDALKICRHLEIVIMLVIQGFVNQ